MSRIVEEGDFDGYSRLYHPEAVLVDSGSRRSYPIARVLAGWRQGFRDTREGRVQASVTFRFAQRMHGETTAHETGIFRYTLKTQDGEEVVTMVHFEGLLVRNDGTWVTIWNTRGSRQLTPSGYRRDLIGSVGY